MARDLNPDEHKLLGRLCRAGENGLNARTWSDRLHMVELEKRGYADWLDGRLYLVTEAGQKHWSDLQAHTTPSR